VTITGHEEEFRRLFEQEAGTRLGTLAERAMELESRGDDRELVAEMFRDAHTLKGGAAVVGFEDLAAVVHELEQLLEELRSGARTPDGALVDGVLGAVDALREMVAGAMAGADAPAAAAAVRAALARARAGEPAPEPEPAPGAAAEHEPAVEPEPAAEHEPAVGREPAPAQRPESSPRPPAVPVPAPTSMPRPAGPAPTVGPSGEAIPVPVTSLDDLVRLVGESAAALLRIGRLLEEQLGADPGDVDEYRELAQVLHELRERTMRTRMVSVATIAGPLRRGVRDISRATGKRVRWELLGEETVLDRHVLEHLREPLVALVRNAVDHGIEPPDERAAQGKPREGVVRVHATQAGGDVVIVIADDGRGIDVERVRAEAGREVDAFRAIFEPGVSTAAAVTGVSGRGVGLDSVRTAVELLRGRIDVRSEPGSGTEFRISVPMTLAVLRCLLVRAGRHHYALPMHSTATAREANGETVVSVDGRPALLLDGETVGLVPLAAALGLADDATPRPGPAVVLGTASGRHAFGVDELLGQRDVVIKDVGRVLGPLPLVAGASVEPDGSVMLVLDPDGLIAGAGSAPRPAAVAPAAAAARRARILVVDDALTIRELQRSILERAGHDVVTASDGEEALRRLADQPADLVLTDVEMPHMDGIALTEAIRDRDDAPPVMILTSRGDEEDRRRGLEAGAAAYLVKSAFDAGSLLAAVDELLP
jgi:two-component system, chemotaxis family, sensor kinase CheA